MANRPSEQDLSDADIYIYMYIGYCTLHLPNIREDLTRLPVSRVKYLFMLKLQYYDILEMVA